ncbi:lipopolysaccharide kinase InaA family protein [Chitinibacter tainanensis]|uniref:lipopolysaccharide kinase InaA family protein n=1 Tax=Chitinibacter tainanensis TaxID=230667 RepID=UPI002356313C|nr:lipopolysaccharide kinase InaA family protein [Chitinibacter tainanensis]
MAGPPSLESCTRDVYPAGLRFTRAQAEAIYGGIASAVNAMNAAGLIHGDVYAHNLLWYGEHSYLGDLGAASLFDPADQQLARRLQVIEARALAHLRAELFSRVSAD